MSCYAYAQPSDFLDVAEPVYLDPTGNQYLQRYFSQDPQVWFQTTESINRLKIAYNGIIFRLQDKILVNESVYLKKEKNLQLLDSFLELKENWNDHGAKPFTPEHISFVKSIVEKLNPQPQIFPTAAKGIHLEYDKPNGDVMIFDIKSNNTIKFFRRDSTGTIEKKITLDTLFDAISEYFKHE